MQPMVLDLFSGIGCFSLGLERAGFRTVAFCEAATFPRRVLAKHWPEVPCYDDIRTLTADRLRADGIAVDVVCGGFPCFDLSAAGRGAGLDGEQSGLWFDMLRVTDETRPDWLVVENVGALCSRGLDVVLGGLAAIRYDAVWHRIPAAAIGAPHERDRVWIVAYPALIGCGQGRPRRLVDRLAWISDAPRWNPGRKSPAGFWGSRWPDEPALCRVDDGTAGGLDRDGWADRIRALGNALMPQIAEELGHAIMEEIRHDF